MKIIEVEQGTPEWHAHRALHRNGSDAPAVMGASKNMPRNEFVRIIATGDEKEYSRYVQEVVFARGKAVEAMARPIAESIIGEDLFPIVGVHDDGYLAASSDGLTMDCTQAWECKQWNEGKAALVRAGKVPDEDRWQCVQVLYVSGAERLLYMVTDGTRENCVYVWFSLMKRDERDLLAGWKQFEQDVLDYKPSETVVSAVAEVQHLPAVSVQVNGAIEIASNLPAFSVALKDFIGRIDMKPETDQAFAEAEAAVKTLEKAQAALEAAKASGLAQVATVDEMVRTADSLTQLMRSTRLALEKMVKGRKDEIRADIAHKARHAYNAHLQAQQQKLKGRVPLVLAAPDFAGAMKGKKTISSLRGAVDDLLAKAKIEANKLADDYAANLATLDELAPEHQFLFRDLTDLVTVSPEHLPGIVKSRVAEHEAAEQKRLDDERERIRKEEEARANREAEAKAEKARQAIREEEQVKARAAVAAEQDRQLKTATGAAAVATPVLEVERSRIGVPVDFEPAGSQKPLGRAPISHFAMRREPPRPTDTEVIGVLADHYRVHESKVIEWLMAMDLNLASAEMAKEFS